MTPTRKPSLARLLIRVLIVLLLAGAGAYLWITGWFEPEARFVHYTGFDIDMPQGYMLHGVDVSKHQGKIYWPAVKKMHVQDVRIGFAFIKATEGLGNVDRQFRRNWARAKESGVPRGAYHFFLATKSGKAQAENFIHTVTLEPGDLPPVLDIEQLYGVRPEQMRKEVLAWLQTVEQAYHVKPILYSYVDFYEQYLGTPFDEYPLWIAHYVQEEQPRIKRDWIFWQHNEQGNVDGIESKVDFNVFKGDSTDFRDLLLK
ncbi:glycoside hydrolase family 25 protein [Deminuibacter soli]|uniref:Glycoside hydrolase family 25 protein n=1 Tax=Deminuibacter soli TaxID=2291815 RepID=A0A3E1NPU6_9BACT|nr:GH25 family lysozyme [Deminuibacter soli]RFM29951.1 glycoside hydrolase family 25 protein [Deminuibacter soli]